MKNYEALFVLKSDSKEDVEKVIKTITDSVKKNKGSIIKEDNWGQRPCAYPIKKQAEGVYYKLDFSIDPLMIEKLNGVYNLNSGILRTLIIKR